VPRKKLARSLDRPELLDQGGRFIYEHGAPWWVQPWPPYLRW
jgi:hypothetical protein